MPNYKAVDAVRLDAAMTATADAIREKTSGTDPIPWNAETGFAESVAGITGGGAAVSVPMKDVNFYDYDGTRLYSYTVAEAAALTELPPLPTQPGLICQGWNWTLDKIKAMGKAVDVGAMYITDDGKTRIYITLDDWCLSPYLGLYVNGTVTIDWGDGTQPDSLTGTSITSGEKYKKHNYAISGDYIITLTVDGAIGFVYDSENYAGKILCNSDYDDDGRVKRYIGSIYKIEIGNGVNAISRYAFAQCSCLETISIPAAVSSVDVYSLYSCSSLKAFVMPFNVSSLGNLSFSGCYSMTHMIFGQSLVTLGNSCLSSCHSVKRLTFPESLRTINNMALGYGTALRSIDLSHTTVSKISAMCFDHCTNLVHIKFPATVTRIFQQAFQDCFGVKIYDFSALSSVPTLDNVNAFASVNREDSFVYDDFEFRVPAALADQWKAATNWSTYADYIVGV